MIFYVFWKQLVSFVMELCCVGGLNYVLLYVIYSWLVSNTMIYQ
jgi:hypothetical protein